jgi:hypothetical protein
MKLCVVYKGARAGGGGGGATQKAPGGLRVWDNEL